MAKKNEDKKTHRRILAIDYGTKYIGLAISDPLFMTAQGRPTIIRTKVKDDINKILDIILADSVELVIVGNPISDDGKDNATSKKCKSFAQNLGKKILYSTRMRDIKIKPEIIMWNERFSTQDANLLLEEGEIKIKNRKKYLDQLAAVMILESYISSI